MKVLISAVVVGFLLLPFLTVNTQAQTRSEQIEALKKQVEEIQRQNQRQIEELRKKIEALEAEREAEKKKMEEQVTKQKAEDKEGWQNKFEAGYKDGLFLKTKDGNFLMKMNILGQFQFSVKYNCSAHSHRFRDKKAQTNLEWKRF
jgi:regulator of replication initiation timing